MQHVMVRFILKPGPRSHIGDEELKRVGILRVEDHFKQLKLNHVLKSTMKLYQTRVPGFSLHQIYQHSQVQYNTRGSAINLLVPKT